RDIHVTGVQTCALPISNGTASAAGTEVAGGTYERQTLTVAAPSGGATSNAAEIVFAGMPACTVVGVEVWDSADTPVRFWFGPTEIGRASCRERELTSRR